MKNPLPALLLVFCACLAHAFEDPALSLSASQYHQLIRDSHAPAKAGGDQDTLDVLLALGKAERLALDKQWGKAIDQYEAIIASGADEARVWLRLSRAWQARAASGGEGAERALQAAFNAYRAAQSADEKAEA
ncbi:MAG: hypothetical protein M3Z21_16710, partial [Pseudomonadota bacterium]|nr:hypothetical protein [Pseudomonadota bacterium]